MDDLVFVFASDGHLRGVDLWGLDCIPYTLTLGPWQSDPFGWPDSRTDVHARRVVR
jgi:hypothetical protein